MTCTGGPTAISRPWLQPRRDRTGPPAPAMRRGEWPNGPTPSTAGPQIGPLRGRVRGSIACWRMSERLRAEPRRGLLRVITGQVSRPGTFTSVTDLIAANKISIGPWNDRCERFTWTNHSGLHPRQSRPPQEAHTPGGPASRHYGVEIDCGGADVARDERLVSAKPSRPGTGPPRVKATDTCYGPIRQA